MASAAQVLEILALSTNPFLYVVWGRRLSNTAYPSEILAKNRLLLLGPQ